jgi:hypothetical protein
MKTKWQCLIVAFKKAMAYRGSAAERIELFVSILEEEYSRYA